MPTPQQRTSSRGFSIPFGTLEAIEIEGKISRNKKIVELETREAEEAFSTRGVTTVDLGTPQLRTRWDVQTLSLGFSALGLNSESVEKSVSLQVAVLVGGQVEDVTLIEFKVPPPPAPNESAGGLGIPAVLVVPQKLYVLELYAPIVVTHGQQVTLQLSLAPSDPNDTENPTTLLLIDPVANMTVEQQYPG